MYTTNFTYERIMRLSLQAPKMLHCEHSFCCRCCQILASRSQSIPAALACPTCSATTLLPAGGVENLQTNTTVVKMLGLLELFCPDKPESSKATSALAKARSEIAEHLRNLEVLPAVFSLLLMCYAFVYMM